MWSPRKLCCGAVNQVLVFVAGAQSQPGSSATSSFVSKPSNTACSTV